MNTRSLLISTQKFEIRRVSYVDVSALFCLYGVAHDSRFCDESVWRTLQDAQSYVASAQEDYEVGTGVHLLFTLQNPKRVIGNIRLKSINQRHRRCDLEFFFAPHHQNNRWVFEGIADVLHYVFEEWKLNRVYAEIDSEDTWSEQMLVNLGFTREGSFPRKRISEQRLRNCVGYGLLCDEWPSLRCFQRPIG